MLRPLAALALLLALVLAACGGDEDGETPTASATPSPSATAAATPSDTPTPSPQPTRAPVPLSPELAAYRAIFVRNAVAGSYEGLGELWMSRMDGSDARRITKEGESAKLAGIAPHPTTREEGFYLVTLDGATARTLWAVDLATSERLKLFSFESRWEHVADAAISPDGRYVAYAHSEGIDLVDLYTGARRHLLDNGPYECDAGSCRSHSLPQWSPDGKLLAVRRTFWEGGTTVILDPFAEELSPITNDSPDGPWATRWSADGGLICGHGGYGESLLYTAQGSDWVFMRTPGYEQADWNFQYIVGACDWLVEEEIVLAMNIGRTETGGYGPTEDSVELLVYDRAAQSARVFAAYDQGISITSGGLFVLPEKRWVITQQRVTEPGVQDSILSRAELINTDTADRTPVLQQGDWVVDVLIP